MHGCLFCKKTDVNFKKKEHIIPESIGNTRFILPKGVVCDNCNQYFSKLDNYFCHHHLAAAEKLLFLDRTKKGKPPSLILQDGEMRKEKGGRINFKQSILPGMAEEQFSISFFEEDIALKAAWYLPDTDSKKISRFLAKAAIETLYLKKDTVAFQADFDYVRNYARNGSRNNYLPFLWCKQPHVGIDIYILQIETKKNGIFDFGTVFLPNIAYIIPLNRVDENALTIIQERLQIGGNTLDICEKACLLKREPIELMMHLSKQ